MSASADPKRLYYKIGEACRLLDIQPYVLRYWETEFPILAPSKSRSGQRVYSESELAIIRRIKELLYQEGFTIAGAKKRLETELASGGVQTRPVAQAEREEPSPGPVAEAPAELDTSSSDQIETLRAGIQDALRQAQQILLLLRTR
ncbi:MAG: MerR family transcriptional regulator [Thermoanaerobaculia bacterium]